MDKEQLGWLLGAIERHQQSVEGLTDALRGDNVLRRNLELQALIAEREGMVAENQFRHYLGQAPAHVEDSFLILAERIRAIAKEG